MPYTNEPLSKLAMNVTTERLSNGNGIRSNGTTAGLIPSSNPMTNLHHDNINNDNNKSINIDPTLMNLVKDFFNSQFELKKAPCPFPSATINNSTTKMSSSSTSLTINYNRIRNAFRALGKSFEAKFEKQLYEIIKQIDLNQNNCCATFHCLSNEMFVNGIQWNHIVTYFVFSADFAYYASQKGHCTVMDVAGWLAKYTSDNLVPWIEKNGGWDGIVNFAQETIQTNGMDNTNNGAGGDGVLNIDLKNILCGAAGALGVLSLGLFFSSK